MDVSKPSPVGFRHACVDEGPLFWLIWLMCISPHQSTVRTMWTSNGGVGGLAMRSCQTIKLKWFVGFYGNVQLAAQERSTGFLTDVPLLEFVLLTS